MGESGGSSGCIASITLAFSATGTTIQEILEAGPQRLIGDHAVFGQGASFISELSKAVASAPPRAGAVVEVRIQLNTGIHRNTTPGYHGAHVLDQLDGRFDSSSRPGRPSLALLTGGGFPARRISNPPSIIGALQKPP